MMCVMTGQLVLFGPVPFLKLLLSHKCVFFIYLVCIPICDKVPKYHILGGCVKSWTSWTFQIFIII